jgi:hypothetical protein
LGHDSVGTDLTRSTLPNPHAHTCAFELEFLDRGLSGNHVDQFSDFL